MNPIGTGSHPLFYLDMSKYIEVDKLKTTLEARIAAGLDGYGGNLKWLLETIDSLQQEQQDFPTTDEEIQMFLATHPKVEVPNKYKAPDWLWNEQEQPEVDLEKFDKDVTKIWGRCAADPNDSIACLHIETFNEVARHFYRLGKLNARGEE